MTGTTSHPTGSRSNSSSAWQSSRRRSQTRRSQEFVLDRNYILDLVNSLESISEKWRIALPMGEMLPHETGMRASCLLLQPSTRVPRSLKANPEQKIRSCTRCTTVWKSSRSLYLTILLNRNPPISYYSDDWFLSPNLPIPLENPQTRFRLVTLSVPYLLFINLFILWCKSKPPYFIKSLSKQSVYKACVKLRNLIVTKTVTVSLEQHGSGKLRECRPNA